MTIDIFYIVAQVGNVWMVNVNHSRNRGSLEITPILFFMVLKRTLETGKKSKFFLWGGIFCPGNIYPHNVIYQVIGNKWEAYLGLLQAEYQEGDALDALGLKRLVFFV